MKRTDKIKKKAGPAPPAGGISPDFLSGLLDSTNLVVYLKDREGRYIYVNRRYEQLSTVPRHIILGKTDDDFFKPEVAALFRSQDARVAAAGRPMEFEETIPLPGGELSFITEKFPLFDDKGEVCAVGGFCTEITTQKNRAEESLAKARERLAVTMRSISDGVLATDTEGLVTTLNPAAERITGTAQSQALGRPVDEVLRPDGEGRGRFFSGLAREAMTHGARGPEETGILDPGGTIRTVVAAASPVRDRKGDIIGAVISLRDVTDRKLADAELFKMRSLRLLGFMAGGIAHDFNNILTGILGNLSLLSSRTDPESLSLLKEAQDACGVAKGLSHQLLTFSSGGNPVTAPADLRDLVKRAAEFAARGSSSRCVFLLGDRPLAASVDTDQAAQVIQNLVINAAQAMPRGGEIRISAKEVTVGAGEPPPLTPGNYVRVAFADQGSGIPVKDLPHIFDPYFTTKSSGRGLGLSICYSIMDKHGGAITAGPAAGGGAEFALYFPVVPAEGLKAAEESGEPAPGEGRVLLMDDEPVVARTAERMLRRLGYRPDIVADGDRALDAYKKAMEEGDPYALAVLDLTVPGAKGGRETALEIIKMDPRARILVSSGYSDDPVMADFSSFGFAGALKKPYRVNELSEAVRLAIKRRSGE